jgi:hypothetical protein
MLKHYLKKYLKYYKVRGKMNLSVNLRQQRLYLHYQDMQKEGALCSVQDTGLRVFSQFEEDGMLLYLFVLLDMPNRTFVEFGSDDGINSNSANLHYHHRFSGLFMDENIQALERGAYFFGRHKNTHKSPVVFKQARITAENINELIKDAGFEGEIGLLSIDIDGNDYWVWKALEVVKPLIVIIEAHNEFGLNNIVVPYDPDYRYPGKHPTYHGASPIAMMRLASHKGYRLVGANDLGFNFIFIREDLLQDEVPTVSVESLLQHPSNIEAQARFEAVKDWEFVTDEF